MCRRIVVPLADHRTEGASIYACGTPCEEIGKIKGAPDVAKGGGEIPLQPQQLGYLHLQGHLTANILEQLVLGGIDLIRLHLSTMVHPQYDVLLRLAALAHRQRSPLLAQYDQRASGIEADALDLRLIDIGNDNLKT